MTGPYEKGRLMCGDTHGPDDMKGHREKTGHVQAQEGGSEQLPPPRPPKNQPCRHLDFVLVASGAVRQYVSVVVLGGDSPHK